MTFDEIFQSYVDYGFTKPMGGVSGVSGVSGIETLMPTTATVAPITPIQQPQIIDSGGNDRDTFTTDMTDTTTNAGIMSLSDGVQSIVDLYSKIPTPMNLAIRAIQNIQDPYKNITGVLNTATQAAITRESVRDLQDRIDAGQFGSTTATAQDARRGGQYGGDGGSSGSSGSSSGGGRDAGMGMGGKSR